MNAVEMRKRLTEVRALVTALRESVNDWGEINEQCLRQQIATLQAVLRFARRNREQRDAGLPLYVLDRGGDFHAEFRGAAALDELIGVLQPIAEDAESLRCLHPGWRHVSISGGWEVRRVS